MNPDQPVNPDASAAETALVALALGLGGSRARFVKNRRKPSGTPKNELRAARKRQRQARQRGHYFRRLYGR